MTTTITKGIINLNLDNVTSLEAVKLRNCFVQLIELQIHRFGPGRVIMHFDKDKKTGNTFLMEIEVQQVAWKRKKFSPLDKESINE